jgi:acetyltransferase-like isoleucine patch superfamily enzyme
MRRVALLAGLVVLFSSLSFAQVDAGTVRGTVTDASDAVVPNAKVSLQSEDTGLVSNTKTDERGNYTFSPVKIGRYTVSVEVTGFSRIVRPHIPVEIQQQVRLDFTLQPGAVEQTIDVTAPPPVLQTENASVGQVVASRQIQDLPLNGRNYIFLAQLAAGVNIGQKDSRGENSNGRFSANGTRATQNNYLLDGIDNNSAIISRQNGKDFVVLTPVDALAEFKIQTNNYSAEFGRSGGAVMNATVKSGTNAVHGDAWEFLRNNSLDANDFFQNAAGKAIPEYRRNQFGFTQGGPIYIPKVYDGRNKTFFFFDYEGTRIRQGQTDVSTVPTLAERSSGFTDFSDLIAGQSGSRTDVLGRKFASGTILDPATTQASGTSFVRDAFPGNVIPANRIDPNAVKILNLLPSPTGPGILANYLSSPVFADNMNSFDIRIDQIFNEHDQIFGRYSYSFLHRIHPGPFTGYADGGDSLVNSNLDDRAQNAVIGETHIFSPSVINQIRFGLNREHALWLQPNGDVAGIPSQFGIEGVPQAYQNGGLPQLNVGSLSRFGSYGFLPSSKYGTTPQLNDDLTINRGSHTFKTGFLAQHVMFPFKQPPQSRGLLSYSGAYTSVVGQADSTTAIAQLLLAPYGDNSQVGANQVQMSTNASHDLRRNYYGIYFQDDWKVTRRLTLNLGLRWDYFPFLTDRLDGIANFLPGLNLSGGTYLLPPTLASQLPSSFTTALAQEGVQVKSMGQPLGEAQKTNFAPRAGIAYQLTPKLVVRAGFGIFYGGIEEIGGSPLITENFPIEYTVTRTALTPTTPIVSDNSLGLLENTFLNLPLSPSTVNVSGLPLIGFQYDWKTPYTESHNLMVQYQVTPTSTLTLGYVGSNSRHVETVLSPNPVLRLLPPGTNSINYIPYPKTATSGNNYTTTQGSNRYNSLQTSYEKRFSSGLSFLANFTWQKALTNARDPLEGTISGYRAPWLPGFGIGQDFALADFDVPRVFHFSGVYELPLGRGKRFASGVHGIANQIISGWSMNWILTLQDGQPFTVGCPLATSTGFGCNAFVVSGVDKYANSSVAHFVNPAAFSNPPAVKTIGQSDITPLGGSATQVIGPAFRRFDLSLFKRFPINDRVSVEFRAESFNTTNSPNFSNPSLLNFLDTTSFGRITTTRDSPNDPREIQFGLKLYW